MSDKVHLGKEFEKRIHKEAPIFRVTCWQIPSELRYLPHLAKSVPIKSYPDFTAGIDGMSCFFDAKATKEKSWSLSDYVFRFDKHANKLHQWEKLLAARDNGNIAGYLIWFYELHVISWASVAAILACKQKGINRLAPDNPTLVTRPDDRVINLREFLKIELDIKKSEIGKKIGKEVGA